MPNINTLIGDLDWNKPKAVVDAAIAELINVPDIGEFDDHFGGRFTVDI